MNNAQLRGTPVSGTTSGLGTRSATLTGVAGCTNYITDASGSSDTLGATLTITEGSNTIYKVSLVQTTPFVVSFQTPLRATTVGTQILVTVNGSTSAFANAGGFQL